MWKAIKLYKTKNTPNTPYKGVRFSFMGKVKYLSISVGHDLAKLLKLCSDVQNTNVALDKEINKIMITKDDAGEIVAKRQNNGNYRITINSITAERAGINLECDSFTVNEVEFIPSVQGHNSKAIIRVAKAFMS